MERSYRYLIIGAGLAGHSAAEAIRQRDSESSLVVIGDERHRPYNRPPLTKSLLAGQIEAGSVYVEKENYYRDKGIELITEKKAVAVDTAGKTVSLAGGDVLGYEKLLLATGGRARKLGLPGSNLPGIFTVRTVDDSLAIKAAAIEASRVVVIGGGFIGAEVASTLAELGKPVTMVFPEQAVMQRILPADLGAHLMKTYVDRGVEVLSGDLPAGFEGNGRVKRVETKNGASIDCDLVVVGIGINLSTGFLEDSGLEVTERGEVLTDRFLETSAQGIWAAGDIARYEDTVFGRRVRVEHWDTAKRHGETVGAGMAGERIPYAAPPFFFTKLFEYFIQINGHFSPDDVVRRGASEAGSVGYFSFRDGVLEGYLNIGRPAEEQEAAKRLIAARQKKVKIEQLIMNESVDLRYI